MQNENGRLLASLLHCEPGA